jgi:hypothetical protein
MRSLDSDFLKSCCCCSAEGCNPKIGITSMHLTQHTPQALASGIAPAQAQQRMYVPRGLSGLSMKAADFAALDSCLGAPICYEQYSLTCL